MNKLYRNLKFFWLHTKRFVMLMIRNDPENIASKTIKLGATVLGVFLVIFIIWGVVAPINSASIAPGQVVLDFNKKTIQHLEGGIIEKILVKEGEVVVTNQPLIYLRDIQTRSQNEMLKKQLVTNLAIEARLKAERDDIEPHFLEILQEYGSDVTEEILEIVQTQRNLFQIRRDSFISKTDILKKRIDQLHEEILGISAQLNATDKELGLLYQQQKMANHLVKSNNSPLNDLIEIKKQIAVSEGKKGELEASIAKAKQSILETELEIINLKNENLNEVLAQLQDVEVKVSDVSEQLASATDILKRTVIKAPTSGIVTDLKYHTIGAVISPASEIMYIVPKDDELIIEARVKPADIDNVKAGLKAKVQLTAFKAKKVPKLTGELLSVSADILLDEVTGEQYFLARIKIDDKEISNLKEKITLYPGMPAQAFIITGSRSLFTYLFDPITEASYKAFREE